MNECQEEDQEYSSSDLLVNKYEDYLLHSLGQQFENWGTCSDASTDVLETGGLILGFIPGFQMVGAGLTVAGNAVGECSKEKKK